ncbi:MAG: type 2 lantipeptide synthetase LanM family protein, partial [Lachnospiraceae bacterium]|nr:type 2 lantipeptide synthetase LanM family protein [Lachnospiraceae bacterium]
MENYNYMFERNYCQSKSLDINDKRRRYWEDLLGKEIYEVVNSNGRIDNALVESSYTSLKDFQENYIWKCLCDVRYKNYNLIWTNESLQERFVCSRFYTPFVKIAENMLISKCQNNKLFRRNQKVINRDFEMNILEKVADCSIRMLILEMNLCKSEGNLRGSDPESEYKDYVENWLNDQEYFMELLNAYPALVRLLIDVLENTVQFYAEILENYQKDESAIHSEFGYNTSEFLQLTVGGSDSHMHGKSVAVITYADGCKLVYKPHSLEAEYRYQDFLQWLGEKANIQMKTYRILDRGEYGWEEFVEHIPCISEDELKEYYKRLGLIICVNYMLNVHDVHNENIIASGAFPIVIDAETLLKNSEPFNHHRIAEVTLNEIRGTVMAQGILPQHLKRKKGNQTIDLSGMSNDVGKEYPRKVPVLIHPKRSDMKCVYNYPKEVKKHNLPILKTDVKRPIYYVDYILEGFEQTYRFVLENKDLIRCKYNIFKNMRLRHLRRDTQIYGMLLTISKHPDFLGDCAHRQMILMTLYKNRNISSIEERTAIEEEILQMLYNDIPMFSYNSSGKDLFSGYGNCIKGYFEKSAIELAEEKLKNMDSHDLLQQKLYIVLSVTSTDDIEESKAREQKKQEVKRLLGKEMSISLKEQSIFQQCKSIVKKLEESAIYNLDRDKVGWIGVSLVGIEEIKWNVVPLNYDLYNGIGGIAIFLHAFCETYSRNECRDICNAVDNSLDEYIKSILEYDSIIGHENGSGYFSGECSLLNVFLILFKITSDGKYLDRAEKLVKVIENQIKNDDMNSIDNDIVSGLAGTIITFLKLYQFTNKSMYLEIAENAGEKLLAAAQKGNVGIGWGIPGQPFILAGLSHGASGIVLALIKLWELTKKKKFLKAAKDALYEEDSLYSEKIGNWVDRRLFRGTTGEEAGRNPATWCHGSGGILLARIKMRQLVPEEMNSIIKTDIENAYTALVKYAGKK